MVIALNFHILIIFEELIFPTMSETANFGQKNTRSLGIKGVLDYKHP
jgi:hypothetical protein